MGMGTVIGPAIGGLLSGYALSLPLFIGAGISFIAFILILTILPESLEKVLASEQTRLSFPDFIRTSISKHGGLVLLLIFIASLSQTGLQGITGLYMVDKFSMNSTQVGIVWMALASVLVIAQGILIGFFTDKIPEKALIKAGLFGGAGCLFGITLTRGFVSILLVLSLFALSASLTVPTLNSNLSKVGEANKGALMGMASTVRSLSKVVGALLLGYLYEKNIELPYIKWSVGRFNRCGALFHMERRKETNIGLLSIL